MLPRGKRSRCDTQFINGVGVFASFGEKSEFNDLFNFAFTPSVCRARNDGVTHVVSDVGTLRFR